jgi:low affinity Fe/Cu permease
MGPVFRYSDTWQLVINTGTTVITFLMVFVIQNSQNRESAAMHLKLNDLIHSLKSAHNELIDAEERDEEELKLELDKMKQNIQMESGENSEKID